MKRSSLSSLSQLDRIIEALRQINYCAFKKYPTATGEHKRKTSIERSPSQSSQKGQSKWAVANFLFPMF
jgi:hypothetical protein